MQKLAVAVLLGFSILLGQNSPSPAERRQGYESITPNDLKAHLTFLASEELEGRETATRGQKVAAQYISAMFRKFGLKPAGGADSYAQRFDLHVTKPDPRTRITVTGATTTPRVYAFGKDFITTATKETALTAPAVFVGFMDAALTPEQESSLSGKIAIAFAGRAKELTTPDPEEARPFIKTFRNSIATLAIMDEKSHGSIDSQARALADLIQKGHMALPGNSARRNRSPLFQISSAMGINLLREMNLPLDELRRKIAADSSFAPFLLKGLSLTLDIRTTKETVFSENVAGMIEGSDPKLKNEYVIITAHYDHLGKSVVDGSIYHGADDDGSGTSLLLELAEAFSVNPVKPRRSLMFMAVAGEEKGLLGSRYYSENPLLPLGKTAANLNIDMVGRTDKKYLERGTSDYIYVIGSDKISLELDSLLHAANNRSERLTLDYRYNDDNDPNQFYRRSDHYHFARKGVPVVFFFTGLHEDYHRPTDTVDKIQFDKMTRIGRLVYETAWEVSNFDRMLKPHGKPSRYSN